MQQLPSQCFKEGLPQAHALRQRWLSGLQSLRAKAGA